MHITWEKPNLNQQVHHVTLTLTLKALHSFKHSVPQIFVFKYFVTDDDVLKLKNVLIFLKITICFLLSQGFESYLSPRMNNYYFDHKHHS